MGILAILDKPAIQEILRQGFPVSNVVASALVEAVEAS